MLIDYKNKSSRFFHNWRELIFFLVIQLCTYYSTGTKDYPFLKDDTGR
jgi:hypothetical protein